MSDAVPVLCVDHEPGILEGLAGALAPWYRVATGSNGREGLKQLQDERDVRVVVAGLRMPIMDGIAFLSEVRERFPQPVRVLFGGEMAHADWLRAVNEAHVYRVLPRPCTRQELLESIADAAAEYERVSADRLLREAALRACVTTICDILALAVPAAFARAARARGIVADLADDLAVEDAESVKTAALLSCIGWITLPPETARRIYLGQDLDPDEEVEALDLARRSAALLDGIPGLEEAREIVLQQDAGPGRGRGGGGGAPLGARILAIALDYDRLESSGLSPDEALERVVARGRSYERRVLHAFVNWHQRTAGERMRRVPVGDLEEGMTLAEELRADNGMVLVARGRSIGPAELAKLAEFPPDAFAEPLVAVAKAREDPFPE